MIQCTEAVIQSVRSLFLIQHTTKSYIIVVFVDGGQYTGQDKVSPVSRCMQGLGPSLASVHECEFERLEASRH